MTKKFVFILLWVFCWCSTAEAQKRVIVIAIDSLHPAYLAHMPNLSAFLKQNVQFTQAHCHLPAATDMNHFHALSGTHAGQAGFLGVSVQFTGFQATGKPTFIASKASLARWPNGDPVKTLFDLWPKAWGKKLMVTGKPWIGEMFRDQVDLMISGLSHPAYVTPPVKKGFLPKGAPRTLIMRIFDRLFAKNYQKFVHDDWVVEAALAAWQREKYSLSYILLAQMDDAQHAFGTILNSDERNPFIKKPALIQIAQETDRAFQKLLDGLKRQNLLADSEIVVLSDHSAITHLMRIASVETRMKGGKLFLKATHIKPLIAPLQQKGKPYFVLSASSIGFLYGLTDPLKVEAVLEKYQVYNPESKVKETPWIVLNQSEMKSGLDSSATGTKQKITEPGELYHPYFAERSQTGEMKWPELMVLMKNGWQLPVYDSKMMNLGIIDLPYIPEIPLLLGGHGSLDTTAIVLGFAGPSFQKGITINRLVKISDVAPTLARLVGLQMDPRMIGKPLLDALNKP